MFTTDQLLLFEQCLVAYFAFFAISGSFTLFQSASSNNIDMWYKNINDLLKIKLMTDSSPL
jgi:hypothetical protein